MPTKAHGRPVKVSCRGSSAVSSRDHRKRWPDAAVHGVPPRRWRSVCQSSRSNGGSRPGIQWVPVEAYPAASAKCRGDEGCRGSVRGGPGEFPTKARMSSARPRNTGERCGTKLWPLPFVRGAMPSSGNRVWRIFMTASGDRDEKCARIAPSARFEYSVSSNLSVFVPHQMQRTKPLINVEAGGCLPQLREIKQLGSTVTC